MKLTVPTSTPPALTTSVWERSSVSGSVRPMSVSAYVVTVILSWLLKHGKSTRQTSNSTIQWRLLMLLKSIMLSIKISSCSHLYVKAKFAHVMLWFSSISPNCTVTFCAKSSAVVTPCSQKLYMMVIRVPPASGPNSGVALNSTDAVNNATTNARLVSMYTYNHVHLHYTYNDTVARAAGSYVCTWRNKLVHSYDATIQSSAPENEADCAFCEPISHAGRNFIIMVESWKRTRDVSHCCWVDVTSVVR